MDGLSEKVTFELSSEGLRGQTYGEAAGEGCCIKAGEGHRRWEVKQQLTRPYLCSRSRKLLWPEQSEAMASRWKGCRFPCN